MLYKTSLYAYEILKYALTYQIICITFFTTSNRQKNVALKHKNKNV